MIILKRTKYAVYAMLITENQNNVFYEQILYLIAILPKLSEIAPRDYLSTLSPLVSCVLDSASVFWTQFF